MKKYTYKQVLSIGFFSLLVILLFQNCSPKTSPALKEKREEAVKQDTATQVRQDGLSECTKFSDIKESDEAIEAYVLFRDFYKLNKFDEAYKYWKKVYRMAPAADGKRYTVFTNGVYIFEHKIQQTQDSSLIYQYIDTIFTLYDQAIECYPSYDGFLTGRKAFDIFYKYPKSHTERQQYYYFLHSIQLQGKESPAFVINPFTSLLVSQFKEGNVDTVTARKWAKEIQDIISHNVRSKEDPESWSIVEKYSLNKIEDLESIKGFFTCDYYKEKYLIPYKGADTTDCEVALQTYSKLRWGGCSREDSSLIKIEKRLKEECDLVPGGASGLARDAYSALREGDYDTALKKFSEAIEYTDEQEKKARYSFMNAKIHYIYLKNFPESRRYALKAAAFDSDWGEPYILIGKLYASSGPLCGSGRGWNSQVVVWPAIDKWTYAKKIDPSVRNEAQSLIDEYWQYMPTNEDISKRLLKKGETFYVDCWINESTTIRTSRAY